MIAIRLSRVLFLLLASMRALVAAFARMLCLVIDNSIIVWIGECSYENKQIRIGGTILRVGIVLAVMLVVCAIPAARAMNWYAWDIWGEEKPEGQTYLFTLENGIFTIGKKAGEDEQEETVTLYPKDIGFDLILAYMPEITEFCVETGNPYVKAMDGVLFSRDGKTLIAYPPKKQDLFYTIPKEVREIGECAFYYNDYLEELTLPEGMIVAKRIYRDIEYGADPGPPLRRLNLPSTIQEIDPENLKGSRLLEIKVSANNKHYYDIDGVLFAKDGTLVKYPIGRTDAHYDVPKEVTAIGKNAFCWVDALESISLPQSVKVIEAGAFSECAYLSTVAAPLTLARVETRSFSDCPHLQPLAFSSLTQVEEDAFHSCPLATESAGITWEDRWAEASKEDQYRETIYGLLLPSQAGQEVILYAEPSTESQQAASYPAGTTVRLNRQTSGFWEVTPFLPEQEEAGTVGYAPFDQVQVCNALYSLFQPAVITPRTELLGADLYGSIWTRGGYIHISSLIHSGEIIEVLYWRPQTGQWYYAFVGEDFGGDVPACQVAVFAASIPEGKTYGVVSTQSAAGWRALREHPDGQSAVTGRFFAGTQVDMVAEQGDWCEVRIGFQQGYMRKSDIQLVEVAP